MGATDNQKTAIKNLLSYVRTQDKYDHSCITKKEIDIIEGMSFDVASRQIDKLIKDVGEVDYTLIENRIAEQDRLRKD